MIWGDAVGAIGGGREYKEDWDEDAMDVDDLSGWGGESSRIEASIALASSSSSREARSCVLACSRIDTSMARRMTCSSYGSGSSTKGAAVAIAGEATAENATDIGIGRTIGAYVAGGVEGRERDGSCLICGGPGVGKREGKGDGTRRASSGTCSKGVGAKAVIYDPGDAVATAVL